MDSSNEVCHSTPSVTQKDSCPECQICLKEKRNLSVNTAKSRETSLLKPTLKQAKGILPKHVVVLKGDVIKYKCTVCDKTFKCRRNCSYHKHCSNKRDKPFHCNICDRTFSHKVHLNYHTLGHTGLNPYKCSICEKPFRTKGKVKRHEKIHNTTSEKKYSCDLCDRTFLWKSSADAHKRRHLRGKSYDCSKCDKSFLEKHHLLRHVLVHTGKKVWTCDICRKSYSLKWNLNVHRKTHTRSGEFMCEECNRSFSQKRYLQRHYNTHKDEFICALCDVAFSRKDNLVRHMTNTHFESGETETASEAASCEKNKVVKSSKDSVPVISDVPQIRTQSVIKSVSKSLQIGDFSYNEIESMCRRSVITHVGKPKSCDSYKGNNNHEPLTLNNNIPTNFQSVIVFRECHQRFQSSGSSYVDLYQHPGMIENITDNSDRDIDPSSFDLLDLSVKSTQ